MVIIQVDPHHTSDGPVVAGSLLLLLDRSCCCWIAPVVVLCPGFIWIAAGSLLLLRIASVAAGSLLLSLDRSCCCGSLLLSLDRFCCCGSLLLLRIAPVAADRSCCRWIAPVVAGSLLLLRIASVAADRSCCRWIASVVAGSQAYRGGMPPNATNPAKVSHGRVCSLLVCYFVSLLAGFVLDTKPTGNRSIPFVV